MPSARGTDRSGDSADGTADFGAVRRLATDLDVWSGDGALSDGAVGCKPTESSLHLSIEGHRLSGVARFLRRFPCRG